MNSRSDPYLEKYGVNITINQGLEEKRFGGVLESQELCHEIRR